MAENDNEYLKMLALAQQQAGQKLKGYGNFQYSMEPNYQKALQAVTNPKAFSYDAAADPVYAQYADQYRREGSRAMEDTLGKISARTGGLASSYAATAAQQENDRYAQALADKIPELYNQAYNRYLQEYQQQLQGLNALQTDRQQAYGMWGDRYNRLRDQYNMAADAENQAYTRQWNEAGRAYDQEMDAKTLARQAMLDEATAKQQEWENQVKLANMGYSVGDYSGYEGLGITPNEQNVYDMALAQAGRQVPVGGYGGGGGGGGGGDGGIDSKLLALLKESYPDGTVTNEEDWNYLLSMYDEATLNAAGYHYGAAPNDTPPPAASPYDALEQRLGNMMGSGWDFNSISSGESGNEANVARESYPVTNRQGRGWVYVRGIGRVSWQELLKMVVSREVKEDYDPKTEKYTYTKNTDQGQNGTK